ncbi:MAG: type 2 lanthipeptide synthetase LanM, partial [Blastocatellia bacterium]
MKEYPVMARQSVTALNNWANVSLEFCGRLLEDLLSIRDYFNRGAELGPVVGLTAGAGDNHRQGRSVCILTFGSGLKLVYKPRPLSVDIHFQELLAWANRHGADPGFLDVKVLDRGSYGWIEFVEATPCRSKDEISRFYSRQGGYLALLYVLRATDFHFENLIACGEHPVLIDLESLFHRSALESKSGDATSAGAQAMDDSVLSTGLLPFKLFTGANQQDGIDMSGLGGAAGQLTPGPVSSWEDAGTDTMRFARKRMEMPACNNRPSLNGIEVNTFDYTREIVSGFTSMYRLLERDRDDLVSANGPLERFAGDEVRCVLRPTWSYARLLLESFHPNLLRNALNRDCLFDQLWRQVESRQVLKRAIEFEREDLQNGDIPM